MHKQRLTILILAILGAVGTFLPWVTVPFFGSINGTEGDGYLTLALYAITLIFTVLGNKTEPLSGALLIVGILLALVASGVGVYDIQNVKSASAGMAKIGIGLYIVAACGILITVFAFVMKGKKEPTV